MENVSLIDVSSEDDLLIASSSDRLQRQRSSGPAENRDEDKCMKSDNPMKMSMQWEHSPELSKSPEQKRPKPGKVNLRKSLAWDSAFTGEGVLNTEELAIVNSTFRRTEAHALPGIQEELRRSTESTSTLDSECYTVENIEEDLFENVRASIQKTLCKTSNTVTRVQDASHHGSRKKVELPFQNKAAKGSGDAKLLKPPRVVPKSTLSTVRISKDSSGSIQNRNVIRRTSSGGVNQEVTPASTKTTRDSCIVASRSSKPTPGSRMLVFSTVSSASNSPVNSSSQLAGKSPLESSRKRSALRNPLPGSTTKTPVGASKSRLGLSSAQWLPTRASSTFKLSSGVSPSSSIDSFSSEASSSASASIKPSKSVESLASSTSSTPSLAISADIDASQPPDQPFINKGASGNLLPGRHLAKAPTNTHAAPGAKSFKPSGLRMPSPKIGYFDAEKTLVGNPSKFSQSSVRSSLLKSTTGTRDPIKTEKPKSSRIPSIRPTEQHVPINSGSSKGLSLPQSPSMRSASPLLMHHQQSKPAHAHKDSSPLTGEGCHKIEGNGPEGSGEGSFIVADNGAQAAHDQIGKEKQKSYLLKSQDCTANDFQKENLLPVYETTNGVVQIPSDAQKVSAIEITDYMSSLSLSETSNFVNGD